MPNHTITLSAAKDAKLIEKIIQYQKSHNLPHASDALRQLCEDALKFKEAVK